MSVRLWDDSNCRYVSDREKCRYVSGMKQLSPRLWDGAAPEKCRYVSGMGLGPRCDAEAGRGLGAVHTVQRDHPRIVGLWGEALGTL